MNDLYSILGVSKGASKEEIRKARKKKAQALHPDRNKSPTAAAAMVAVNQAADILENDERRARYDQTGETNRQESRESRIRKALRQFMLEAITQPGRVNVPAYVLQRLEGRRPEIAAALKEHKRELSQLRERLEDVTTDDEVDMYRDMVQSLIDEQQRQVENGKAALEDLKSCIEIAKRYRSKIQGPPSSMVGVGRQGDPFGFSAASGPGFDPGAHFDDLMRRAGLNPGRR